MIREYISAAMAKAEYEILCDDGSFYGEIPGFQGVYTLTQRRLRSAALSWKRCWRCGCSSQSLATWTFLSWTALTSTYR